jgi:hypothetical protein
MAHIPKKSAKDATRPSADAPAEDPQAQEAGSSARVEQIWAEIESYYRKINGLINGLPQADRSSLFPRFQKLADEVPSLWWAPFTAEVIGFFVEQGAQLRFQFEEEKQEAVRQVKDHFTVKPRMTARDEEVVRLRDEEKLEWKDILKRIRSNPEWAASPKGKQLTMRALIAAYHRRKKTTES